jgi:membrane protein implicated in regulation of membrane protease activity
MDPEPQPRSYFRGASGLVAVLAVIALLVLWLPAYRWFLLISSVIGILVASALYLWHRFKPLKEEDVNNKRPLGLE